MRVLMGIILGPNGVFYARKKVPSRLEEAVAKVTDATSTRVSWLKRSLRTTDRREANIVGKPILIEFDHILARAEAQLKPLPICDTLSQREINRIADYYYAEKLTEDDDIRQNGTGSEPLFQGIAQQLSEAGSGVTPYDTTSLPPAFGLSKREMDKISESIEWALAAARSALARGDISELEDEEELSELLAIFRLNLDRNGLAYRQLGLAVLRKKVAALETLSKRHEGEPIETPHVTEPAFAEVATGGTLRAALEGWKKTKVRGVGTVSEFDRAVSLFEELHGNIPVAGITRAHVRQYREALQAIPVRRSGHLRNASLSQLVEWTRKHPESARIAPATINKLIAGPMAIASWAYDNGIIPDDAPWTNPFAKMLLDVDEAQREPWQPDELRTLLASPVFTCGARPKAGRGEAAYWLPLLGMFTGARLSELASLATSDLITDEETGVTFFRIAEDEARGRKLKTVSSRRAIPVHPTLVQLGFFTKIVGSRLSEKTVPAALFPELVPGPRGHYSEHWSKWFGRYIRDIGIENKASVFHSFRHGFKDALRCAGISEDINDALTGHAGGGVGRSYGAKDMIRRFGLPRLAEAISKVEYAGLDLSHLERGAASA